MGRKRTRSTITDVKMKEEMNCHAYLQIQAVIADETQEEIINLPVGQEQVKAGFLGSSAPFFSGSVADVSCFYEKGQMMEGAQDLGKMGSGDFSQSYNWVRDGIFGGNQDIYNMVMYGSIMLGASGLLAMFAGGRGWGR